MHWKARNSMRRIVDRRRSRDGHVHRRDETGRADARPGATRRAPGSRLPAAGRPAGRWTAATRTTRAARTCAAACPERRRSCRPRPAPTAATGPVPSSATTTHAARTAPPLPGGCPAEHAPAAATPTRSPSDPMRPLPWTPRFVSASAPQPSKSCTMTAPPANSRTSRRLRIPEHAAFETTVGDRCTSPRSRSARSRRARPRPPSGRRASSFSATHARDPLRMLQRPPVRQVRRDPRRPKRVAACRRRQPRRHRTPLDHRQHGPTPQRPTAQPPRAVDALKQRPPHVQNCLNVQLPGLAGSHIGAPSRSGAARRWPAWRAAGSRRAAVSRARSATACRSAAASSVRPAWGLTTSEYGRDYRVGYGLGLIERPEDLSVELGVDAPAPRRARCSAGRRTASSAARRSAGRERREVAAEWGGWPPRLRPT